jgi:hypothetical protein
LYDPANFHPEKTSPLIKCLAKPSRLAKPLMQWLMFTMGYVQLPSPPISTDNLEVRFLVNDDFAGCSRLV